MIPAAAHLQTLPRILYVCGRILLACGAPVRPTTLWGTTSSDVVPATLLIIRSMTELIWSCHYTPGSRRTKKPQKENRVGTCASNARFHCNHQTTLNDGRNIDKVAKVAPTTVILLVLVLLGVVAAAIPPVVTMYARPRRWLPRRRCCGGRIDRTAASWFRFVRELKVIVSFFVCCCFL